MNLNLQLMWSDEHVMKVKYNYMVQRTSPIALEIGQRSAIWSRTAKYTTLVCIYHSRNLLNSM